MQKIVKDGVEYEVYPLSMEEVGMNHCGELEALLKSLHDKSIENLDDEVMGHTAGALALLDKIKEEIAEELSPITGLIINRFTYSDRNKAAGIAGEFAGYETTSKAKFKIDEIVLKKDKKFTSVTPPIESEKSAISETSPNPIGDPVGELMEIGSSIKLLHELFEDRGEYGESQLLRLLGCRVREIADKMDEDESKAKYEKSWRRDVQMFGNSNQGQEKGSQAVDGALAG